MASDLEVENIKIKKNTNQEKTVTEENKNTSNPKKNKTLVIAAVVVVLVIISMYFHDQKQQRAYELRRLEKRVELLEEWGRPQQNMQSNTPPPAVVAALIAKGYVRNDTLSGCFSFWKGLPVKL